MSEKEQRHRLDMWLKHVCLFKHRNEATQECNGGKIKLNGRSAKASAGVKEGDVIELTRGDWERKFVVLQLPEKQLAKELGREAYRDESGRPPERRSEFERVMAAPARDKGTGRPTKRDRRALEKEGFRKGE